MLGDTDGEARELAEHARRQQVSGPHAIMFLEHLWNQGLSAYDPDGPLPDVDPDLDSPRTQGSAQARSLNRHGVAVAEQWRERAHAGGLSIRELVIEMTTRQAFIGTPATAAEQLNEHVQTDACDGFILAPTSRRADLTASPARSYRYCASAACSGPTTPAPRSESILACQQMDPRCEQRSGESCDLGSSCHGAA